MHGCSLAQACVNVCKCSWLGKRALEQCCEVKLDKMLCCLCREVVPPDHKWRKRLHGDSCATAKSVLQRLAAPLSLHLLQATSEPDAVLCYNCNRRLTNIFSLEKKLEEEKALVKHMLSSLYDTAHAQSRKRLCTTVHPSVTKAACIDSNISQSVDL